MTLEKNDASLLELLLFFDSLVLRFTAKLFGV
jgi:hypothetical protein